MSNLAVNWPGNSGTTYTFDVYEMSTDWNDVPGIYIFAKEIQSGSWKAIYVGETGSFKTRMTTSHGEWLNALLEGVTHVHAMVDHSGSNGRLAIEDDLILSLRPPLNQKLSSGLSSLFSR